MAPQVEPSSRGSRYNAAMLLAMPPKEFWYFAAVAVVAAVLAIQYVVVGRHRR